MGLGYIFSAAALLARRQVADGLVLLYAIGLATKVAETIVVAICAFLLLRRPIRMR